MSIEKFLSRHKFFSFYALDLSMATKDQYQKIIEVFEECFMEIFVNEMEGLTIIYYTNFNDVSIENMLPTMTEDFGFVMKVFQSHHISTSKFSYVQRLVSIYKKYSLDKARQFTNIRFLTFDSLENEEAFHQLKEIILSKVLEDSKLEDIIMNMFDSNLNVCKTANAVYMHRNTIHNKLDVIEQETGLDMQNFYDAVVMYILLKRE